MHGYSIQPSVQRPGGEDNNTSIVYSKASKSTAQSFAGKIVPFAKALDVELAISYSEPKRVLELPSRIERLMVQL